MNTLGPAAFESSSDDSSGDEDDVPPSFQHARGRRPRPPPSSGNRDGEGEGEGEGNEDGEEGGERRRPRREQEGQSRRVTRRHSSPEAGEDNEDGEEEEGGDRSRVRRESPASHRARRRAIARTGARGRGTEGNGEGEGDGEEEEEEKEEDDSDFDMVLASGRQEASLSAGRRPHQGNNPHARDASQSRPENYDSQPVNQNPEALPTGNVGFGEFLQVRMDCCMVVCRDRHPNLEHYRVAFEEMELKWVDVFRLNCPGKANPIPQLLYNFNLDYDPETHTIRYRTTVAAKETSEALLAAGNAGGNRVPEPVGAVAAGQRPGARGGNRQNEATVKNGLAIMEAHLAEVALAYVFSSLLAFHSPCPSSSFVS